MPKHPRIFIAGTGRSGTTLLYDILRSSADVYALPVETRFIIDPDGLIDLVDALTIKYSPTLGRQAIRRFEALMLESLIQPDTAPYVGFRLDRWLGERNYRQQVNSFLDRLVELKYVGRTWQSAPRSLLWRSTTVIRAQVNKVRRRFGRPDITFPRSEVIAPHYFEDRNELLTAASRFVDALFMGRAREKGCFTWCEKTPYNLLHLDFLWDLFPNAIVLHIKRDPRAVAYSYTKQEWAPDDLIESCRMLRNVYDRWETIKCKIEFPPDQYLEIKLEDLASDTESVMGRIATMCTIRNEFPAIKEVSMSRVDYWQDDLDRETIESITHVLGNHVTAMGYEL